MSVPLNYNAAMKELASLADAKHPAYVRVKALTTIVRELSPNNLRHRDVIRALDPAPAQSPSRLPAQTAAPAQANTELSVGAYYAALPEAEFDSDDATGQQDDPDDEPEGTDDDDRPP